MSDTSWRGIHAYVSSALDKLGVPYAGSYLDKVVQIRMPLPSLIEYSNRSHQV